ncbi:AMP-binding protein [Sulfolobus acidocaldarius]|uniref:AMP-binding protein n=1 Tax=Sulfolobus acidocaldarius TaxID=2285 RepID=UPI0007848692|nr:AMP-binding protein [Sulfolobus acidocaldarius]
MANELIKNLVRDFIDIQKLNPLDRPERINDLFTRLNFLGKIEDFNWVRDIYEEIHVKDRGGKTALMWYDLDTKVEEIYTYQDLLIRANKLINFLKSSGIGKGDPVYLMTPVFPEQWVTFLATIKAGFVLVPTANNLTAYELGYRFADLKPKVIIADPKSAERIDQALGDLKPLKIVVRGRVNGWTDFELTQSESESAEAYPTSSEDDILNYFTSGTTGLPKRVIHTATSYPLGHLSTASIIGVSTEDIHLNLSAPGWAKFAWSSFFSPLIVGATIMAVNYEGRLNAQEYLSVVDNFNVTSFCAPPTAWRLFNLVDLWKFKFHKLRNVVSAGEPLNPEIIKVWKDKFDLTIRDFYGQTETTAIIGNPPWRDVTPGSFGIPSPLYDVVLLDDEGKEITKPFDVGHIAIRLTKWRAIPLFKGYSNEEKNKEAFRNGYYFTGDKGYFDDKGNWYFVARADDVIKTSDYRVGPFEVESALIEHPAVAEAAVVGSPDPVRWQLVKAFVVLKPGYSPSYELAKEPVSYTHLRDVYKRQV